MTDFFITKFTRQVCEANHRVTPTRLSPLSLVAIMVLLSSTASAETRSYKLTDFDGVMAAEGIHVFVDVGEDFSVTAESEDPTQLERLQLDVRRGTLRAEMDNQFFSFTRTKGWKVNVHVAMPELVQAEASSGAELVIDDVSGSAIELAASSGSSVRIESLVGEVVSAKTSSGAQIHATNGKCGKLEAAASSGSSLHLNSVKCEAVRINASSGATAGVFADNQVDAKASSGGNIRVYGAHKKTDISSSSGGNIALE